MAELRLVVAGVLGTVGAALVLLAAVGVIRMPDLLTRMQASSKAGTLGAVCVLAGVAIDFGDPSVAVRALLITVFLFLTAPVAAHAIARAGYRAGAVPFDALVVDELARDLRDDVRDCGGVRARSRRDAGGPRGQDPAV